ncbi:hypothetical protein [Desulfolithobacter sp.]
MEHGLVKQGLTMLQEGVATVLAERFGLDWRREEDRTLVSDTFHVLNQKISEDRWNKSLCQRPDVVRSIIGDTRTVELARIADRLSKARNDINHSGFRNDATRADRLEKVLGECFVEVEKVLGSTKETEINSSRQKKGEK